MTDSLHLHQPLPTNEESDSEDSESIVDEEYDIIQTNTTGYVTPQTYKNNNQFLLTELDDESGNYDIFPPHYGDETPVFLDKVDSSRGMADFPPPPRVPTDVFDNDNEYHDYVRQRRRRQSSMITLVLIALTGCAGIGYGIFYAKNWFTASPERANHDAVVGDIAVFNDDNEMKNIDRDKVNEFIDEDDLITNEELSRYDQIYEKITQSASDPILLQENSDTPQRKALRWLVLYDPSHISPTHPSLLTRYALTVFFFALKGQDWNTNGNWIMSENVCNWYGVLCDGMGRVVGLRLSRNRLNGSLEREIAGLVYLEDIYLNSNAVGGTIPISFGELTNLETLELQNNALVGTIPVSFGKLTKLENLILDTNQLEGSFPSGIGNLGLLKQLHLHENRLSGSLQNSIGRLVNLERLWLSKNQFTGSLPKEIKNMDKLRCLYLDENKFTGTIPPEIAQASHLDDIRIDSNSFSGSLPSEIGSLSNLNLLYFDANQFTGSIPSSFGKLTNLRELALQRNELDGTIPPELGMLTDLIAFSISENKLVGVIPRALGNLSNLNHFRLFDNNLQGPIPDLSNSKMLDDIQLNNNDLIGPIPYWIAELTNIKVLILSNNKLSGRIPTQLTKIPSLTTLKIDQNDFNGDVPGNLCVEDLLVDCELACGCCSTESCGDVTCGCCSSCVSDGTEIQLAMGRGSN